MFSTWLLSRFTVYENSGRVRWNCGTLAEAIGDPLTYRDAEQFVTYVRNLARDDKGWTDLFVLPPAMRRAYALDAAQSTGPEQQIQ